MLKQRLTEREILTILIAVYVHEGMSKLLRQKTKIQSHSKSNGFS